MISRECTSAGGIKSTPTCGVSKQMWNSVEPSELAGQGSSEFSGIVFEILRPRELLKSRDLSNCPPAETVPLPPSSWYNDEISLGDSRSTSSLSYFIFETNLSSGNSSDQPRTSTPTIQTHSTGIRLTALQLIAACAAP